ncbi:MAG TPA: response regulator [Anaeromyxobacteraceae bacterium]|nr:response regulator [Anaeromyxobacteraceae bacterium]
MDGARLRVLLVEDDDDNRELMAEVLESAGFLVTAVESGAEGLRRFRQEPVDLILTDFGLPGTGGLELARSVKAIAPRVPVVVVTGYSEHGDLERARGHEVDEVLLKPVDPDALAGALTELIHRTR